MKPELLAPAGDFERLRIALLYGADAVYFGGQEFSLRANAQNFSLADIKRATNYAHQLGKKVYVAVNIILHNSNLKGLKEYLKKLDEIRVDAVIASDITVIKLINELNLNMEIHVSTQASNYNYASALFYKNLNVKRIVLARETSKEDIKEIKKRTNLDLECFVHGAMCTSFSGKCVLSNYLTNRDSNRGGCAQICRWTFNDDCSDIPFTIMSKDLNMIENIKEMIDVGVNSFKVEGRMRSIYYIATVILCYRHIIDKVLENSLTKSDEIYYLSILNRCANRDSMPQFFLGVPDQNGQYFQDRNEASNQDFLGLVLDYDDEKQLIKLESRNYFKVNDDVTIFGPNTGNISLKIHKIYNEQFEEILLSNHPKNVVYIPCSHPVNKDDMMRIKVFDKKDFL